MYAKTVLIKDTDTSREDKTRDAYARLLDCLREDNLHDHVQVVRVSDVGIYEHGLVVKIYPDNITYANVQESDLKRIADSIKDTKVINELVFKPKVKQLKPALIALL